VLLTTTLQTTLSPLPSNTAKFTSTVTLDLLDISDTELVDRFIWYHGDILFPIGCACACLVPLRPKVANLGSAWISVKKISYNTHNALSEHLDRAGKNNRGVRYEGREEVNAHQSIVVFTGFAYLWSSAETSSLECIPIVIHHLTMEEGCVPCMRSRQIRG